MTRIAVIGNPGAWSTERLADAVEQRTGQRIVVDLGRVSLELGRGRVMHGELDLLELDAVIVKKLGRRYTPRHLDRLEVLRYVQERGVPVIADPVRIARVIDRLSCTVTLRLNGVAMPPTVVTEDLEQAVATVERYGRAVFKPLYSTKAQGMEVISNQGDPRERIRAYQAEGHRVLYIQQMMDLAGQDFGLTFLGGAFVGAYARVGDEGSWNTTTRDGGRYEPYAPSPDILALAQRAQAAFGLELCSVDVAMTPKGPIVFEVSAFGGFRGMLEGGGVDLAPRVAEFALGRVRHDR